MRCEKFVEIKTLKDIPFDATTNNLGKYPKYFIYIDDLKQEAIKWINEMETQRRDKEGFLKANPNFPPDLVMEFEFPNEGLINWIKWFFNITDEELE